MIEWRKVHIIFRKELLDLVRDSRTILVTFIMPLLVFPLLIIASTKISFSQQEKILSSPVNLALIGSSPQLEQEFKNNPKVNLKNSSDVASDLRNENIDAALVIPDKFDELVSNNENPTLTIKVMNSKTYSGVAFSKLTAIISTYNQKVTSDRLIQKNIDTSIVATPQILMDDLSTDQEKGGSYLASMLPLFLIILSYSSGAYTAMDVIAGEKERRTLESLLMVPISRETIIIGKFLSVCAVTGLTVIVATLSLFVSTKFLQLPAGAGVIELGFINVSLLIGLGIILSGMFAGILTAISTFARSIKEAQSYMMPLYLIVILPVSFMSIIPQQIFPSWYFLIPVANALFLFREIIMNSIVVNHILIVSLVSLLVCLLMLMLSVRLFTRENVIARSV